LFATHPFLSSLLSLLLSITHEDIMSVLNKRTSAYLHVVELWDVSDADENRITSVLELHLNAHLCVAHHQAGIWELCLQLEKPSHGQRPAVTGQQLLQLISNALQQHTYRSVLRIMSDNVQGSAVSFARSHLIFGKSCLQQICTSRCATDAAVQ